MDKPDEFIINVILDNFYNILSTKLVFQYVWRIYTKQIRHW
jgi:hypothetical protein